LETDKDEDARNIIQSIHNDNEREFNKKWNWILLCKSVSEFLFISVPETWKLNLFEVLTYGSLLKEQVELIKSRNGNT
jgi:hypothetical protein